MGVGGSFYFRLIRKGLSEKGSFAGDLNGVRAQSIQISTRGSGKGPEVRVTQGLEGSDLEVWVLGGQPWGMQGAEHLGLCQETVKTLASIPLAA